MPDIPLYSTFQKKKTWPKYGLFNAIVLHSLWSNLIPFPWNSLWTKKTLCRSYSSTKTLWKSYWVLFYQTLQVGRNTTSEYTQCLCNHATFFGSLNVRPNPIDPPTIAALKEGYAMLLFVSVIFLLYFIGLIWARRKDKADVIKVTIKVKRKWAHSFLSKSILLSGF